MARPQKQGMDWFPMDCELDKEFKALEEIHGNDGFVWLVKFWQSAYLSATGTVDLSDIHGVIAAKTARISTEKQSEIIRDCIKLGLLKQLLDNSYTSDGILARHIKVNKKRENDRNQAKNELSQRKPYDNRAKSTQSRVEKSREEKKEEKKQVMYTDSFITFWQEYPKKTGKDKAWEFWQRKNPPIEAVLKTLAWQKRSDQWTRDGGQYVPNPATWIFQGRWNDEPQTVQRQVLRQPEMFDDPEQSEDDND